MSFTKSVQDKIIPAEALIRWVNIWKFSGKRIVFTNGCFDILHKGHITYLTNAADLGDILIIGLNSDDSVKMLNKGENRPIQDQDSRAICLASLVFVSAVTIFNEETPESLIKAISPDILVKGGDYKVSQIAGADHVLASGGKVEIIPLVEGYSTTAIVNKLRR